MTTDRPDPHAIIPAQVGPAPPPDPVEAAIARHQGTRQDLQRAADAVGAAGETSRQVEAEADAAFTAASAADGAAWADLLATRPGDVPGAVRLLRYVSASPASEVVEDTQDLLRQLAAAVEAAEAGGRADPTSANLPTSGPATDPILIAITENRRLFDAWTEAGKLPEVPGTLDRPPEAVAAREAFYRHVTDVLLTTVPTTLQGCKALALYAVEFTAANEFEIDENENGTANLRILDLIARSPGEAPADPGPGRPADGEPPANLPKVASDPSATSVDGSDPIYAVIDAHRAAFAEWDRLSVVVDGMGPNDPGFAAARAATEEPCKREVAAFEAMFGTRPTTLPGVMALAEYLASVVKRTTVGSPDGERELRTVSDALHQLLQAGGTGDGDLIDWHTAPPGLMASPAIEPFGFVLIPEGLTIELGRLRGIALTEFERHVAAGLTGEALERSRRNLRLDMLSQAARGKGSFDVPLSKPRDWQAYAEKHPDLVPYPAHAPAALVALDYAIRREAERLLALAEAEVERRRQDYAGHPDPALWLRVERSLRREMRMEALAVVAGDLPEDDTAHAPALDAIALVAAIEAEWTVWKSLDAAPNNDPALEVSRARRDDLLDAAVALPAITPEARHAKALALAWMHYVDEWRGGQAYEDYSLDGRLALDIDAAFGGGAMAAHSDAALLALVPTAAALAAQRDLLYPAVRDTDLAAYKVAGDAPPAHSLECVAWYKALKAEQARNGHDEAQAAYRAADDKVLSVLKRAAETPATTLAGLVSKARLAHEHDAVERIGPSLVADLVALRGER